MMGYSAENVDSIGGVYSGRLGGFFDLNQAFVMAHLKGDKELIQKFDDLITALRDQEAKEKQDRLDHLKKQLDAIPFIMAEQNKHPFVGIREWPKCSCDDKIIKNCCTPSHE